MTLKRCSGYRTIKVPNPIQPLIVRPVHLPHTASTDFGDDSVVAEGATDEVLHCWVSQRGYGIAALISLRDRVAVC